MFEVTVNETWEPWDEPIPTHLVEGFQADAIKNGRTLSKEFNYQMSVELWLGLIPPSRAH